MENLNITTAELLVILAAMEIAADTYAAESNRTPLSDVRRTLKRRAERTRAIASNIKNRALSNSDFADAGMNAALRELLDDSLAA